MSEAAARAAARREKILSKGKSRLLTAKGEGAPEEEEDKKPFDRPLQSRKSLIQLKSHATPTSPINTPKDPSDDPDVDSIEEFEKKQKEPKADSSKSQTATPPSNSTNETPQQIQSKVDIDLKPIEPLKTVKQIEKEVAEQTTKFDKTVLDQGSKTPLKLKKQSSKKVSVPRQPIQASDAMRLIRLFMIIALGIWTGMDSVHSPGTAYLASLNSQTFSSSQQMDISVLTRDFKSSSLSFPSDIQKSSEEWVEGEGQTAEDLSREKLNDFISQAQVPPNPSGSGGWWGWIVGYLYRQTQSPISLVRMVWFLSSLLHTTVHSLLPPKGPAPSLLTQAFNLYGNGITGLVDLCLSPLGEIALHISVLVLAASIGCLLSPSLPQPQPLTDVFSPHSFASLSPFPSIRSEL